MAGLAGAICYAAAGVLPPTTSPAPADAAAAEPPLLKHGAPVRRSSPATQPGGSKAPSPPPQLPAEFDILRTHNPFAHGKGGPGGPNAPGAPEAMFVLRGIAQTGRQYTAFVEDTAAKRVMELPAGSPVATGRIKSVDIDTIEFEAMGRSRRIEVGQNLAGQIVPPTPASKPAGPPPGAPGPANGPPPGPPGGAMPPGARPMPGKGPPGAEPPPDAAPAPAPEQ